MSRWAHGPSPGPGPWAWPWAMGPGPTLQKGSEWLRGVQWGLMGIDENGKH